jgi:hypothetical protein
MILGVRHQTLYDVNAGTDKILPLKPDNYVEVLDVMTRRQFALSS